MPPPQRRQVIEQDDLFPAISEGDVLEGKWRVEGRLGAGGMGTVLLVHDIGLERKAAVKLLALQLCSDEEAVARFEREARLTASLDHPNIVPIYAVGRHGQRPFFVMKYLEGCSLSSQLRRTPPPLSAPQVLALVRPLCEGLAHVHERGLVHRDIKPSNIFVSSAGGVTLLDFGILKDLRGERFTRTGQVLGTCDYMAPEQVRGQPVDTRTDVYALGVLLCQLVTGKLPFGEGTEEVRAAQLSCPMPDLQALAPGLRSSVIRVLERALAMDPARRFQSVRELLVALEDAFAGADREVTLGRARPALAPLPTGTSAPRRRRAWAAGIAALLGTAAGALVLANGREPSAALALETAGPVKEIREPAGASSPPEAALPSAFGLSSARPSEEPTTAAAAEESPSSAPEEAQAPAPAAASPAQPPARTGAARVASPGKARSSPPQPVKSGRLRVVTLAGGRPSWAEISLNGAPQGLSPVALEVPAGRHTLQIKRAGYRRVERVAEVRSGEDVVVRIELQR